MQQVRRLGVPLASRLEMITDHQDHWRIWLGIRNKQVEPNKYEGSFIKLYPDGAAFFCNNETEEEYQCADRRA